MKISQLFVIILKTEIGIVFMKNVTPHLIIKRN